MEVQFGLFPFSWVNGTGESQPAGLLRCGTVALAPVPRVVGACLGPLPISVPKTLFLGSLPRARVGGSEIVWGLVSPAGLCAYEELLLLLPSTEA